MVKGQCINDIIRMNSIVGKFRDIDRFGKLFQEEGLNIYLSEYL